ncbi:MAG: hypothetical protein KKE73_03190 [Proteobacteria bacterium]|nr:hypothetical protein [Pseudomonadota bacterium]
MIDRKNIEKILAARLAELPLGHALEIRTYKRNRAVLFFRQESDEYRIVQKGFGQSDEIVAAHRLKKTLRRLLAEEFPRSNKVRLYALGVFDIDVDSSKHLKII